MLEKYQETQKSGDFSLKSYTESDFSMKLSSASPMQRPPERLGLSAEVTDAAHDERMTWNDSWILHNDETIRTKEKIPSTKDETEEDRRR